MPFPLEAPKLTICGIDPSKQGLLDAIASKKASLLASLKNKQEAQIQMALAKATGTTDSLINKLLSKIPGIPSKYKEDIAQLLKDIIGPPPMTPEQRQVRINQMVTKWGQDKLDELTTLVQDFIDGETVDLCDFANLEKLEGQLPKIKPPESFPASEPPADVEPLVSTVVYKGAES